MAGLADTLATAKQQRLPRARCRVYLLLSTLPEADAAALTAALDDVGFRHDQIHAALRAEYPDRDLLPNVDSIGRHRRNQCSCR